MGRDLVNATPPPYHVAMSNRNRSLRLLIYTVLAAAALSLYAWCLPGAPGHRILAERGPFAGLPGDLPTYGLRFAASALVLGVLPVLAVVVLTRLERRRRGRPAGADAAIPGLRATLGLGMPSRSFFAWRPFLVLWAAALLIGVLGAFSPGLAEVYPYSRTLTVEAASAGAFLIHAGAYLLTFYLPWELFFRGLLILPLLEAFTDDPRSLGPETFAAASLQAIPSTLLHFGHPLSESLAALAFGLLAGYLVLRFRCIWPSLILHVSAGIALDATLVLRSLG